jgi:hypothetical protein
MYKYIIRLSFILLILFTATSVAFSANGSIPAIGGIRIEFLCLP